MSAPFIKICGLQTAETVRVAVDSGADAVGFVFAPGSPRTVSAERAAELGAEVDPGVETVGVFRNQDISEVLNIARRAALTTVQLHGNETVSDLERVEGEGFRTMRALSAPAYAALAAGERRAWEGRRLLLDAVEPGAGEVFDAAVLGGELPRGFWLLAGGLNPGNVAGLIAALGPAGVDVSSGVESSRGVKDPGLIRAFIAAARGASTP
ncbi:phosphoribosylanthranilate isomerase [Mycetocola spongiae]|uniref:phosphoribosylanthranilate isomerase n=1 Tax=Mycetocola spongiae TaxID=2859226 RepID=UPI001CF31D64|nr:phosphoribosylanthranilate isomerase [Mycetocola spongiae]UCR90168.1 phosphoribosylanthranilate isomerase [Mycetocola spongiae]